MESIKPAELRTAARIADALVYAAGLAGVVAGGLLFRDGNIGFAIVAWALTFIAGAMLRLAAWVARALAELLTRSERMTEDLDELLARGRGRGASPHDDDVPDPYRRWGHR